MIEKLEGGYGMQIIENMDQKLEMVKPKGNLSTIVLLRRARFEFIE